MTSSTCQQDDLMTSAVALWDHVTLDPVELGFKSGDVIEVVDMLDKDWWWGKVEDRQGWFPSAFVLLQTTCCDVITRHSESAVENFDKNDDVVTPTDSGSISRSPDSVSRSDSIRAQVVREIVCSERDYVKHLHDVIQGYLVRVRNRKDMFSEEDIATIFGNIEEIYQFALQLLTEIEKVYNPQQPHLTQLGSCFVKHQRGFEIYSEYCNNHQHACNKLFRLKRDVGYQQFFEACRLLQGLPSIPLDGFLLSPVQKICKYPVQLKELLRHTDQHHADYGLLQAAVDATRWTARLINERKRKLDSMGVLLTWQDTVADWQGADLTETSSELIHAGELFKVSGAGWTQDRLVFLFDHQLVYCKRDILWKDMLLYRGRINMDSCTVLRIKQDYGSSVRHGFKLYDHVHNRWYLFTCHNVVDYDRWVRAFDEERRRVTEDRLSGFDVATYRNKALTSHRLQRQVDNETNLHANDKRSRRNKAPATHHPMTSRVSRSMSTSPPP